MISMAKYTMEKIIEAGRTTYSKFGEDFTMSDVARELNTKASSLYRHVTSKRELYFAMLTQEFNIFNAAIEEIIKNLAQPTPETILKEVGGFILKMAREDSERFMLMFMTKPPEIGPKADENDIGPHEQACNPQTIGYIHNMVSHLFGGDQQDTKLSKNITFFLVSLVVGAGLVTSPTYEYSNQGLLPKEDYEQFHEFVISNSLKLWRQPKK